MKAQVIAPVGRWHRLVLVLSLLTITVMGMAAPGARVIPELNFMNAEIPVVLKALADFTGTNIVVGPAVKGQITVKLKGVTLENALDIITQMSGLGYAKTENAYVVNIPGGLPPSSVNTTTGLDTAVIELKYLSNAEASKALALAYPDLKVSEVGARLIAAGTTKRLDAAQGFLAGLDTADAAEPDKASSVFNIKYITLDKATQALSMMYGDVTLTKLDQRQVVLSGEKNRVAAAKGFLGELDTPVTEQAQADSVEQTYRVKYVIPTQAKDYLDYTYRGKGLFVSFAPGIMDTVAAPAQPAVKPEATVGNPAEPAMQTTWSSHTLVLHGSTGVVKDALASLALVDVESPAVEKRCTVKRIFPSQAIAYLLDRYEPRGLTIATAPMNYVQLVSDKDASAEAAKVSKGSQGQIGAIVHRNADGTLNITEPVGDFILRGPDEVVTAAAKTLEQIDIGPERIDKVVMLRYLKADDVQKQLDKLYSAKGLQTIVAPSQTIQAFTKPDSVKGAEAAGGGGGAAATAAKTDEVANLVLRGPEAVVAEAVQLINQIDILPPQVSLNAQIVSMTVDSEKNLGVQWPDSVSTKLNEQQSGKAFQFGRIVRDPISLQVTLNALESQHKAKVISRPSSVVKNGYTSYIHVGKLITFDTFKGLDAAGNKVFSTDTLTTGVTLYVRPVVSPDGTITLDIMSGVTDDPIFRVSPSGSDLPQVNETATTTTVQVRDGETLVIGGLTQQKSEVTRTGVPILSHIPLIGALFTNKDVKPAQAELLIMVTPSIVKPGTSTAPAAVTAPAQ